MTVLRVPSWGFDHSTAEYYGWRHCLHIGPVLIFWGRMTEDECREWWDRLSGRPHGRGG